MIMLIIAVMIFNAAVTIPIFPMRGKHFLVEVEDEVYTVYSAAS